MSLEQTWRWYGPSDPISLAEIKQVGASGIVTALHHVPNGAVWSKEEILKRKADIESHGLRWSVVESVPVHEDIKRRTGNYRAYIEHYRQSLANLADCGVTTVCYNFMPVLDWTRTELEKPFGDGSTGLYYRHSAFAAFDLYLLKRKNAEADYSAEEQKEAADYLASLSKAEQEKLVRTIIAGLPGSEESFTLETFQAHLDTYRGIGEKELRENLAYFIKEIIPVAHEKGVRMAIHPDDPPRPILGLPRVLSTEKDLAALFSYAGSPYNGFTLCTGSFGVRLDNDLPGMVERHGERLHFAHLRSVGHDKNNPKDFWEDDHLGGSADMFKVMRALVLLNKKRESGSAPFRIPFRPDHGHKMLDDFNRKTNPGYSLYGRMKGLAELRGLELGIEGSLGLSGRKEFE